jgi:RNA polymerase sigma-70 factor (ECF subfamily)
MVGHLDADCFHVSAERVRHPEPLGKPVGVLGNNGACVIAKSYEMKAAGVKTGTPVWDAAKLCPEGGVSQAGLPVVRGAFPEDARRRHRLRRADRVRLHRRVLLRGPPTPPQDGPAPHGGGHPGLHPRGRDLPVTIGLARTRTLAKLFSDTGSRPPKQTRPMATAVMECTSRDRATAAPNRSDRRTTPNRDDRTGSKGYLHGRRTEDRKNAGRTRAIYNVSPRMHPRGVSMVDVRPDSPETLSLLERAGAGDAAALGELIARHRDAVRRFVELRLDPKVRGRIDASDVVQEAHMEAVRRIEDYLARRPMPFHLWLCRTAHENLIRLRRRHVGAAARAVGRENPLPDRSSVLIARQVLSGIAPDRLAEEAELAGRVHDALGQLDEVDREVLLLRTFEGLTNVEAAAVLGIEPSAASKRYGRALLRLRQALAETGLTGPEP